MVQNLSLQTDGADLLGGYRPLEVKHLVRPVYESFLSAFASTFSQQQNKQFIDFVKTAYRKSHFKKLSQCFVKAARMGLAKLRKDEGGGV